MALWGKLSNKDALFELKDAMTNLELLADAEEQISEFYRLCADAMGKEADFWNSLADQEVGHAENARKMVARIKREPSFFGPGISFSSVTIRIFLLEMNRLIEKMKAGQISPDQQFAIALEIENSAVEVSYSKIVKTKDGIFTMYALQNDTESVAHKSAISSRINAMSIP